MLKGREICKGFDGRVILNKVDLAVVPGHITVLMGRSGSGKTTLLKALSLVEPPDAGVISFDERQFEFPSNQPRAPAIWPDVTVVFQDLFLWPHLSVFENVNLPASRRDPIDGRDCAAQNLETLGISDLAKRFPNQISRGQRQLVALARGLAVKPKYLLLDEITASLDIVNAALAADAIRQAAKDGLGILAITHQFDFAHEAADHFAYLHEGAIIEQGDASILEDPKSDVLRGFIAACRRAI